MKNDLSISLKLFLSGFFLLILSFGSFSQVQHGGIPASSRHNLSLPETGMYTLALDEEMKSTRDQLLGIEIPGVAPYAGAAIPAGMQPETHGQWEIIDDKLHVWRMTIHSPEALGVGVNFRNFQLSEDARLFVYDPEKTTVLGAFDHRNNTKDRKFSTAVIPGETIVLEYQEPYFPGKDESLHGSLLEVESIIHLGFGGGMSVFGEKGLGDAGDCQVNINCPEGNDWQDEKRGIARMLMRVGDSYSWCTGSLVNNTAQDAAPYFLSAEHCGRNATDYDLMYWQFYFNFEHQSCPSEGTPPYNMVYGADMISQGPLEGGSDFRLLLLQNPPPASWNPYWNGWDRTNTVSGQGVGIHHPRGDAKKISTYSSDLVSASPLVSGQQMAENSAWRVIWSPTQSGHGVSEGGSSGSPIFNSARQIIGTLTGGSSNCDNPYAFDFYGKMWYHWDQNSPAFARRLDVHLDPLETGAESLGGLDPFAEDYPAPGFLSATLEEEQQAGLVWFAPGQAPNLDGWYRYVEDFTHLTWAGPERAVVFDAPALGLSYPVNLKKVAHFFVEHNSHPWPDDRFRFRVYDTNGLNLLYESEELTAEHLQEYVYELDEPLVFDDYFYVAVRPVHSSGHPSTLMKRVNYTEGFSFFGGTENWNAHDDGGQDGSFAYLTAIYVSQEQDPRGKEKVFRLQNLHREDPLAQGGLEIENSQMLPKTNIQPNGYRLYRNNELIFTAGAEDEKSFTDQLPQGGFFRYQVMALYNNTESDPSNTAYLLVAEPCDELIDQWPYLEPFESDFNDQCWINHGLEGQPWMLEEEYDTGQESVDPFAGDFFYMLSTEAGAQTDEWLILPQMDFSELEFPALRFMFNTHIEDVEQTGYLALMVSRDGQSFEKLWDNRRHPAADTGHTGSEWLQTTLNLLRFAGKENIRIAFQYKGQQAGFFAIDNIEVMDAQTISYNLNVNIAPDFSGTVTGAGSYLGGEAVYLKAAPNITYEFEAWMDGGDVLSTTEEYWFVMPDGNKTLTASFKTLPTHIDEPGEKDHQIRAFPNPAQDKISIQFARTIGTAAISMINTQGQIVKTLRFDNIDQGREETFSVTHLPRGVYFIRVQGQEFSEVIKMILTE